MRMSAAREPEGATRLTACTAGWIVKHRAVGKSELLFCFDVGNLRLQFTRLCFSQVCHILLTYRDLQ